VRILLDNAIDVSPLASPVTIATAGAEDWSELVVEDRGAGVLPGERERIFERFQRGSNNGGRGGFGLGLAIGRELATRMGGSLTLLAATERADAGEGESSTGGARFALRLTAADSEDTAIS